MQNEENAVIRYLMKEMDPSEEVLMERAMMEDDDLLIEVESMRQTLHRLNELPERNPPPELSESIVQQAARHKKETSRWPSIPSEIYRYAAVLLIGMGLGSGVWMVIDTSSSAKSDNNEAAISTNFLNDASSNNADTEPWIDRDNVIYFQDMFTSESTNYSTMMDASMNQLTPVNDQPIQANSNGRNLQLTGSGN